MAHFVRIDESNNVIDGFPVDNADCGGGDFPTSEPIGNAFLNANGFPGVWKQTSYSGSFRYNYAASTAFCYDPDKDAFYIKNSPGPGWTFDETTLRWVGP